MAPGKSESRQTWTIILKGKTARVVVTTARPAFFYRRYFGPHGLKNLERNILLRTLRIPAPIVWCSSDVLEI